MKVHLSLPEGQPVPERLTTGQFRRLAGLEAATPANALPAAPANSERVASSIRLPKKRKVSEAEERYKRVLAREYHEPYTITHGTLKFVLPSGTLYTPDLVVWAGKMVVLVVEVKGMRSKKFHMDEGSKQKFKEAITAFPFLSFRYAAQDGDNWILTNSAAE